MIENKDALLQRVEQALDTIRPHLLVDGGGVDLIDVTDDMTVEIKWLGACEGCNMSLMTMRAGIEQAIKSLVPEIKAIKALNGVMI
jgi:Fe-S cluster biogenesis protein NfuA